MFIDVCVNISLILNLYYSITLYMIKRVSLFNLQCQIQPESQSASLPYSGGKSDI